MWETGMIYYTYHKSYWMYMIMMPCVIVFLCCACVEIESSSLYKYVCVYLDLKTMQITRCVLTTKKSSATAYANAYREGALESNRYSTLSNIIWNRAYEMWREHKAKQSKGRKRKVSMQSAGKHTLNRARSWDLFLQDDHVLKKAMCVECWNFKWNKPHTNYT